jgi:hypothetical protein
MVNKMRKAILWLRAQRKQEQKGLSRNRKQEFLLLLAILKSSFLAPLSYENKTLMLIASEGYHWQGN